MALDLHKAALQIEGMASQLQASWSRRLARLSMALQTLEQPLQRTDGPPLSAESFRQRIEAAAARRVTWLVGDSGGPEGLARRYPPPPPPADYAALATDGSQIDVDRHGPAHCFLINVGSALIRYGSRPEAELFSQPHLYSQPEELAIADPQGGPREQPIEGPLLGIKRTVMECEALAERLRGLDGIPILALLDGSLVLWELSGGERFPSYVKDALLHDGLLRALDELETLARTRPLAFASYISRPRSTEVVNILRVARCPHEGLEVHGCDHFCRAGGPGSKECNDVAQGLTDRDLFQEVLEPGERSATFASQSPIVVKEYGRHRVHFFYVNVGEEIARVEMPQWVAEEPAAVELLHALLLDQCRKGRGYPVALQEAHERAVVTVADRRQFWTLVQTSLAGKGLSYSGSEKARSKRIRAV